MTNTQAILDRRKKEIEILNFINNEPVDKVLINNIELKYSISHSTVIDIIRTLFKQNKIRYSPEYQKVIIARKRLSIKKKEINIEEFDVIKASKTFIYMAERAKLADKLEEENKFLITENVKLKESLSIKSNCLGKAILKLEEIQKLNNQMKAHSNNALVINGE